MGWEVGNVVPRATKGKDSGHSDSKSCLNPGFDSKIRVSAIHLDLPCESKPCYMLPDLLTVSNQGSHTGKHRTTKESKSTFTSG